MLYLFVSHLWELENWQMGTILIIYLLLSFSLNTLCFLKCLHIHFLLNLTILITSCVFNRRLHAEVMILQSSYSSLNAQVGYFCGFWISVFFMDLDFTCFTVGQITENQSVLLTLSRWNYWSRILLGLQKIIRISGFHWI